MEQVFDRGLLVTRKLSGDAGEGIGNDVAVAEVLHLRVAAEVQPEADATNCTADRLDRWRMRARYESVSTRPSGITI